MDAIYWPSSSLPNNHQSTSPNAGCWQKVQTVGNHCFRSIKCIWDCCGYIWKPVSKHSRFCIGVGAVCGGVGALCESSNNDAVGEMTIFFFVCAAICGGIGILGCMAECRRYCMEEDSYTDISYVEQQDSYIVPTDTIAIVHQQVIYGTSIDEIQNPSS